MPDASLTTVLIAGVDEAGRGPLAGPVVAAAVILAPRKRKIRGLRDSKIVPPERREQLAAAIRERAIAWAVGSADVDEIDSLNILWATMLAMRRASAARPSSRGADRRRPLSRARLPDVRDRQGRSRHRRDLGRVDHRQSDARRDAGRARPAVTTE